MPGGKGAEIGPNRSAQAANFQAACMTPYPSTAALRGVDQYGSSAASVYSAAKRLLGTGAADDSRRVLPTAAATAAAAEGVTQPLHVRASASAAARAATGAGTAGDIDMAWLTEYATMYQAEARECTGCTGCDPPPYIGCFFPPAADPGPSRAKSAPRSLRSALLIPKVNTGSFYRCGKRT